jgi:type VI secretion system protein ImpM
MTIQVEPGLYGKLPILGDFVSRRLPGAFVQVWDTWLQEALLTSKDQLGSKWLGIYLTSPIWRFVLSPGICGDTAAAGVVMPSVDKVGRYFPLTLAALLDDRQVLSNLFLRTADWFDNLEKLALSALEDDVDLDTFDRELQAMRLELDGADATSRLLQADLENKNADRAVRMEMDAIDAIPEAFGLLGSCLLSRSGLKYSQWATTGSDLLKPSLLVYQGLPPTIEYAGFLTGDWTHLGLRHPVKVPAPVIEPESSPPENTEPQMANAIGGETIQWRSVGCSDVGKVRAINEDAYLDHPQCGIWAVADGMGGHAAGDEASQATVDALSELGPFRTLQSLSTEVENCLQEINIDLINRSEESNSEHIMGCTIVAMLAVEQRCAVIWAGDSRLYRYRNGHLSQMTHDHSPEAEMADPGQVPAKSSRSNIVTRALGATKELVTESLSFEAVHGDVYLLCSDGLDKEVNPKEISKILSQRDLEVCSRELIDLALSRGARDNVTVVVVTADREAATTR